MRIYGLTGGIASGKTVAAALFRQLGVPVIDADQVSRQLTRPGKEALHAIAARWPQTLAADGSLDRARLAAVIFTDPVERRHLEAILHPRIHQAMREQAAVHRAGGAPYLLYEAALLLEGPAVPELSGVILVSASRDLQSQRLVLRDGLSPAQVEARLAAQLPLAEKQQRADWLLHNQGDLAELKAQILALDAQLRLAPQVKPT